MIARSFSPRFAVAAGLLITTIGPVASGAERIELVRDRWGVPHVFAETDAGAMYGLGYATAEDRGFQMHYTVRIMRGRLAELIGDVGRVRRRETAVENDRKMRTFGFARAADGLVEHLDDDSRRLLQAYSDGVNAWFGEHRDSLHEVYSTVRLKPEPWTPADSLLCWWHVAQFFATDGTRDLLRYRSLAEGPPAGRGDPATGGGRGFPGLLRTDLKQLPPDESTAVVGREDVTEPWLQRVEQWLRDQGISPPDEEAPAAGSETAPKFSHAWVAGGRLTGTGAAVLVSEPRTPVTNPSLFYEFHVRGQSLDARGIGVAGSPILLIGWNRHVAWGMTALGADQADLFRLQTGADHPDQYFFDGQWHDMQTIREEIRVKDGQPQTLVVRQTHFGPVMNEFAFARPDDPLVALKRIPVCETDRETIQGALAMMRAADVDQFHRALAAWRFPSANVVFGDSQGSVGFSLAGALVQRSPLAPDGGGAAHDGSASKFDWRGVIPHDLVPHVINPQRGFVFSGNHRPIGSFYPVDLGIQTGSMGDTIRSWRLRELFAGADRLTPQRLLDFHFDAVNPARREIVRLGYHLRDVLHRELSADAQRALEHLEGWYRMGAASRSDVPGTEVALELNTFFRFVSTDLALIYGGGESGLSYFLKTVAARLAENPNAEMDSLEQSFIDRALADAWRTAVDRYGEDPERWHERALAARQRLPYFFSLDDFPSLDPQHDLTTPALLCSDGGTMLSQTAQAYSQWVPLHDVDAAMSLLPPGISERPDSPMRTSCVELWQSGTLHPAPLSREAVEEYAAEQRTMEY